MNFLKNYKIKYLFYLIVFFISNSVYGELIKPSPDLEPEKVISIQLNALMNNNFPYENAGIIQTWEFAHPSNKIYTGPLNNFTKMIYSKEYSIMLEHQKHKIILVKRNEDISYFFIELIDKFGNKFGFQWTVQKVNLKGEFFDCWMTVGVSQPMKLSKSA
tara:strand:+ start:121 stop:600 length:480 start_codon:yes stop_codon:yes gene_type:complete